MHPTGGLPRRKTVLEQLQPKGPSLTLDSGNALFVLEGRGWKSGRNTFVFQTVFAIVIDIL